MPESEEHALAGVGRAQRGDDRRHDLVQVADHRVVGARWTIGASRSVLIARILFAPLQPTQCWIAPLMPHAM